MEKAGAEQLTLLLRRWKDDGDAGAEQELFRLVERELVRIAQRTLGRNAGFSHKIDAVELVNEAYLALRDYPIVTANRAPFFRLMAKAMRNYLMDLADRDSAQKRPPSRFRILETHAADAVPAACDLEPLEYYRALDALRRIDARQADTIELRVFGLKNQEIADEHGIALATVKRDVKEAQAFLAFQLGLPPNWIQP